MFSGPYLCVASSRTVSNDVSYSLVTICQSIQKLLQVDGHVDPMIT